MAEPVDGFSRQVGSCRAQVFELWIRYGVKGDPHHIERLFLGRVCTVDPAAVKVQIAPHFLQTFIVLFFCSHYILLMICIEYPASWLETLIRQLFSTGICLCLRGMFFRNLLFLIFSEYRQAPIKNLK
jgi:hypothetical protein